MNLVAPYPLKRLYFIAGLAFVAVTLLPLVILGPEVYIHAHDHLDSDVVWYRIIGKSDLLFSVDNDARVEQIMNGLPRNSMPPGFHLLTLLFALLPTFTAFAINYAVSRMIGYIGMYLLMQRYVLKASPLLASGVAMGFALLPFWGTHPGIAITGLPLMTYALLRFIHREKPVAMALLLAFCTLYGSLIYTGVFALVILGFAWLILLLRRDRRHTRLFFALVGMTALFVFSEMHLFSQLLFGDFESHRSVWEKVGVSYKASIYMGGYLLLFGHYHAAPLNFPIILMAVVLALTLVVYNQKSVLRPTGRMEKWLYVGLFVIALICVIHGLWDHTLTLKAREKIKLLNVIQWNRFYWLLPFIWAAVFGIALRLILHHLKKPWSNALALLAVAAQIAIVVAANTELTTNFKRLAVDAPPTEFSYENFYSEALFDEIKAFIGQPPSNYRVISIGMPADIAAYNGFYVLDSYQRNYELSYKEAFRTIIAEELEREPIIQKTFDEWGSRCYAFVAELAESKRDEFSQPIPIKNLTFNLEAFKKMGGEYILSAHPILNFQNGGAVLLKTFEHPKAYWNIHLYHVR